MAMTYCLTCGEWISLGRKPGAGAVAYCQLCGAKLELSDTSSMLLDWTDDPVDADWQEPASFESDLAPAQPAYWP
jgi:hypothetical protein